MPTVTVRLKVSEREQLVRDALARGLSMSQYVRSSLLVASVDFEGAVAGLERRVSELERLAGRDY